MKNKKKPCMIYMVMTMNDYKTINRLLSDQYVGRNHIYVKHNRTHSYPQHWHNYFEIELVLSGSAVHTYNGREYTIEKGDAYLLTPVDFHGMEAEDHVELLNISFDDVSLPPSMLSYLSSADTEKQCRFASDEFERICYAAELLRYECESDGPCMLQLLEDLISCFARREPTGTERETKTEHLQGIKKAISYIELHFREPITLEQLAKLSGYNPSYFSDLFRKVTGETYKERLRQLRISYAKMLLSNGFSVSEACFASGFGSLSNFSASFRELCGMSPGAYKKGP